MYQRQHQESCWRRLSTTEQLMTQLTPLIRNFFDHKQIGNNILVLVQFSGRLLRPIPMKQSV